MTALPEEALLDALRAVDDPEAGMNIVELGLVYAVEAAPPLARVRMTMTSPACPLGEYLSESVKNALRARFPELKDIEVEFVWEPPWTPEKMSEEARNFFGWK
jgi:metal-sulfur cluster biosynthetic enzyme